MKKNVAAILTLALTAGIVPSVHSQGYVLFANYATSTYAPVTYTPGGAGVNDTFTAGLWYFLGTATLSDGTGTATLPVGWELAPLAQQFNVGNVAGPAGAGLFIGGSSTISDYVSGPITFAVTAYQGLSYDTAIVRAHSAAFTLSSIATGNSAVGEFGPGFQGFALVPEPSMSTLCSLGTAALMLIRRNK
jgi:hypothetical protein